MTPTQQTTATMPATAQPAPSPVRASTHTHHRLFLGALPPDSQSNNQARRQRYRRSLDHEDAALVPDTSSRPRRFSFLRNRKSTSLDGVEAQNTGEPFFVIGQEFQPKSKAHSSSSSSSDPPVVLINPEILSDPFDTSNPSGPPSAPPKPISRPSLYPRTTTDRASFRTAKSTLPPTPGPSRTSKSIGTSGTTRTGGTDFFSAKSSVSSFDTPEDDGQVAGDGASDKAMISQTPLVVTPAAEEPVLAEPKLRNKLRSALRRRTRVPEDAVPDVHADTKGKQRRTVYFPVDEPEAPRKVLERTGSAVAGTSAGVVEVAERKKERELEREEEGKKVDVRVVQDDTFDEQEAGEVQEEEEEEEEVHLRGEFPVAALVRGLTRPLRRSYARRRRPEHAPASNRLRRDPSRTYPSLSFHASAL